MLKPLLTKQSRSGCASYNDQRQVVHLLMFVLQSPLLCPSDQLSGSHAYVFASRLHVLSVQTLWQQRHICCGVQLHIKRGAVYAHRHSNVSALQCIHCVRAVHHEVVISFATEHTRDLPSQTFELAVYPVLPQRKHLSYLNLQICGAFLPPQRQHCCPDACLPCFPYLLICQGYLPLLCFCANLTRLTFSLGYVPTVAPHGERNCCACSFTTVILTAISTER